jgi:hypothetical protein
VSLAPRTAVAFGIAALTSATLAIAMENMVRARRSGSSSSGDGSHDAQSSPRSCAAWVSRVLRENDRGNERTWRDQTVHSLGNSCDAIPEALRTAATRASATKEVAEKARILALGATSSLDKRCAVENPLADARGIAQNCPLPPGLRFRFDDSILMDLRAVDYGILVTMLKSLIAAGEFNEPAQRLVLNFALSAQILGEDYRLKQSKQKRPPQ